MRMESDEEIVHDAGSEENSTNNRMELTAVIEALRSFSANSQLLIHTDSTYVSKGVNDWMVGWKRNGWRNSRKKAVANMQLWRTLDELLQTRKVKFIWVKGHLDVIGNIKADQYASEQALLAGQTMLGAR